MTKPEEPPLLSNEPTTTKYPVFEPNSEASETSANWMPVLIPFGIVCILGIIFGLGRIAIINSERRDAEKKRGDAFEKSLNALQSRSEEDRQFFEIVRQLMIAQDAEDRKILLEQLRGFQFAPPPTTTTTTTTTTKPKVAVTTTTRKPSTTSTTATARTTTTTTRASPTTTTTRPPPPPAPPPTIGCIGTPVGSICPGGGTRSQGRTG